MSTSWSRFEADVATAETHAAAEHVGGEHFWMASVAVGIGRSYQRR